MNLIRKIISRIVCKHEWEMVFGEGVDESMSYSELPLAYPTFVLKCTKCGKKKWIKYKRKAFK